MHVAWLGKKSPFCGNVTYGREVTNHLLDRGYNVSFLHFAQQEESEQVWRDCPEVFLPFLYKSQIYTIPSPKSSQVLMEALEKFQPDLVHASLTLSPLDFRLPDICRELNLPLVATFHPPFDSKLRNLQSSTQYLTYQLYAPCLANYDRVIVFSEIQKDMLVKLGVPQGTVQIIPNGVDEQKYCPAPSTYRRSLKAKRVFIYQGRIAPEKNVEALLKAWCVANMGEDCLLLIMGDGPLKASLESTYNDDQGIIWLGFVGDETQRLDLLRAADVFILPSLVEGLSLSLLEAMACGLACVATDAGADGEVLNQGAGIVLDTKGVTGQLKTLLPLLRDQAELVTILGHKARQRLLERYTLHNNISQLEQTYQSLCPAVVEPRHYPLPVQSP
ncbi:glycosyl transferase, group 1 family protein [[Synechococcus] sp. NIES-970]|uniref:glycosyltransferase family 4 protein n=1 Tax=Picosynechococcus sp. NKBG15041c TaxID=1407650 RepID=UPI0004297ED6|nr:glycosyltransferase family 4 protein [Picosynechococcus sp. NKBG15041c]BAW96078.1 glycosyl transferase, group 1 family protein [[Synechococcus] sp. NIES-970]